VSKSVAVAVAASTAVLLLDASAAEADHSCNRNTALDIVAGVLDAVASSGSSTSSNHNGSGAAEQVCVDAYGYPVPCPEDTSSSRVSFELGTAVRSFTTSLGTQTGTVEHEGESFAYRAVGAPAAVDYAGVLQLRVTADVGLGFYAGGELEGGVVNAARPTVEMASADGRVPELRPTHVSTFGGVALAGVAGQLGPVELGVEAAGGLRGISYNVQSQYGACESSDAITVASPVLEGRARAAYWIRPQVSVGAVYGKSVLDSAWMGGMYVGFASRAR
jgi:hypothetical protein